MKKNVIFLLIIFGVGLFFSACDFFTSLETVELKILSPKSGDSVGCAFTVKLQISGLRGGETIFYHAMAGALWTKYGKLDAEEYVSSPLQIPCMNLGGNGVPGWLTVILSSSSSRELARDEVELIFSDGI